MVSLFDNIQSLPGIGPARAKQLKNLGVETIYDLIAYFPRSYEDRTKQAEIASLTPDAPACFQAMVTSAPRVSRIRKGMEITRLQVADHTAKLTLVFFNQSYVAKSLVYGESYWFYGQLNGKAIGLQMVNPQFEPLDRAGSITNRIVPIYSLTAGLSNHILSRAICHALSLCQNMLPEILPASVLAQYNLLPASEAYTVIHNPPNFSLLEQAQKRLVFEEFFLFSLGLSCMRSHRSANTHDVYTDCKLTLYWKALPFPPTNAQKRAVQEICHDLQTEKTMNRLLQGDVGSGKTLVAAAAAYVAVQNGKQVAFMAPTEILAEQHFQTLQTLLAPFHFHFALLTGSKSIKEKRQIKEEIANGTAQIVIGTHALLTSDVEFSNLDMVIADEQHKFGVAQRAALTQKGKAPHLLVMSATPIPRTLALLLYGDLDLSILDELPPGRQKVETFLVSEAFRSRINGFIRKHVENGHQVYIVCPAIEDGEDASYKAAVTWADTLRQTVFGDLTIGLLHGQMKGSDKEAVLRQFALGSIQILVSTTVIEVGIDVPNATLMVIENAERFGLSQLHQLRGRVGRGQDKSYCVLISSSKNEETQTRLKALCATNDGFQIAEQDLALRGPGDFFGARQHGLPQFKIANLSLDLNTLKQAQQAARTLLDQDPDYILHTPSLLTRIQVLFEISGNIFN